MRVPQQRLGLLQSALSKPSVEPAVDGASSAVLRPLALLPPQPSQAHRAAAPGFRLPAATVARACWKQASA